MAEQIDTIVGAKVELKGSLRNTGPIQIYGKVEGDIICDSLVFIGETAVVSGPISARHVDVAGQVYGSITAEEQIEMQAKSIVKGDISTARLSIKPGAIFIGQSQMSAQVSQPTHTTRPVGEAPDRKKPRLELE